MISIVIPVYNAAPFLDECLGGIVCQDFADFEVILVDDGSSDGSLDVCAKYAAADSRFSYYAESHSNAGHARNVGMEHAKGEYLLFFDADDIMLPGMLSRLYEKAAEVNADVVCCRALSFHDATGDIENADIGARGIDQSKVASGEDLAGSLFQSVVGWAWNKLFSSAHIRREGLRFQEIESTNDALFVFSALALAQRVAFVEEQFIAHRKRGGSIEASRNATPRNALRAIDAIEGFLSQKPVWRNLEPSFNAWRLEFLYWNIQTLEGDARRIVEEGFTRYASITEGDKLSDAIDGYVKHLYEEVRVLVDDPAGPIHEVLRREALERTVEQLSLKLQEKDLELEQEKQKLADVEQSTSYFAGRLLTLPGRVVKDYIAEGSKDDSWE